MSLSSPILHYFNIPIFRLSGRFPNISLEWFYLGQWSMGTKGQAAIKGTGKTQEYHLDDSIYHLHAPARWLSGGTDKWFYVDPEYPETYTG